MANQRKFQEVTGPQIEALDDVALNDLMGRLLRAQAHRCGASISEVQTTTQIKANDDGCDAWSPKPSSTDEWLGQEDTCWQLKAGQGGEPKKLKGEVLKPIPRSTLENGGRYVVIASGSSAGKAGENRRLKVLVEEAKAANIPSEKIYVIGSERLTTWCNQHPAISAILAGKLTDFDTLDSWARSEIHSVEWQPTEKVEDLLKEARSSLTLGSGEIRHLHIHGHPGVGKTRFALEVCKSAPAKEHVLYISQSQDVQVESILRAAVADPTIWLLLVVDEVPFESLRFFRDVLDAGCSRVKLLTIGHCETSDPTRTPSLRIVPLTMEGTMSLVQGWYPSMPIEHRKFVARFSDGYVRLAKLSADAVVQQPAMDIRTLLDLKHIQAFLSSMIGGGDHPRHLHVLAALTSVGWEDEVEDEGRLISEHLGLPWQDVRYTVEQLHRQYGIAPRGGRYRYISPTPLATYLAVDAWNSYSSQMKSLPNVLPSEKAREAYYDRLQTIASNPQAKKFARTELDSFFLSTETLGDAISVRRWSALLSADPDSAAIKLHRSLVQLSVNERAAIAGRARREIVDALVALAWRSSTFYDATLSLAYLAEAENESWENNATAEFLAKFRPVLSGTCVPYSERLEVVETLLGTDSNRLTELSLLALGQAASTDRIRAERAWRFDEAREPEWLPTYEQLEECQKEALAALIGATQFRESKCAQTLLLVSRQASHLLRAGPVQESAFDYFRSLMETFPETRESLRIIIQSEIRHVRRFDENSDVELLERFHAEFENDSLGGRIRQFVSTPTWESDDDESLKLKLEELAKELSRHPDELVQNWDWLTSGEADAGWLFGQELAEFHKAVQLEETVFGLVTSQRDLRFFCSYLKALKTLAGEDWYDSWYERAATSFEDVATLFEIAWRCGPTDKSVDILTGILRMDSEVPAHVVERLCWGGFLRDLSIEATRALLSALSLNYVSVAVNFLTYVIKSQPEHAKEWLEDAKQLVTQPEAIRVSDTPAYHWGELCKLVLPESAREIAFAVFREMTSQSANDYWYGSNRFVKEVLSGCYQADPVGVWNALIGHLEHPEKSKLLTFNLPDNFLSDVPKQLVGGWVRESHAKRGPILASLLEPDLSNPDSLAIFLLESYGDVAGVGDAVFSKLVSGLRVGPESVWLEEIKSKVDELAKNTTSAKVRRWARQAGSDLQKWIENAKIEEAEEEIGR